jgi:hypothetical protein
MPLGPGLAAGILAMFVVGLTNAPFLDVRPFLP